MTRTPFKPTPSWSLCRPEPANRHGCAIRRPDQRSRPSQGRRGEPRSDVQGAALALPSERALGHQRVLQSEEPPSGLILEEAAPIRSQLHQRSHGELADPVSTSADAGRPDATLQPVNAACCLA